MEKAEGKDEINELLKELEWIEQNRTESEIGRSGFDNLKDRLKKNPFLPVAVACTAAALSTGLKSFLKGDSLHGQIMMRYRVGMQAISVLCLVSGILYDNYLHNGKETDS